MVRPLIAGLRAAPRRTVRPPPAHGVRARFASSGAQTPTPTPSAAQQKVKEALEGAQKGLERAAEAAKRLGGSAGERAGKLLGSYREPIVYNFSVARELLKQVYIAERLQPPTSFAAFQNAYSILLSRAKSPAYWREVVRNGEWQRLGIYAVEAYGIFKIGEIVGRRSLVGYNVE